MIIQIVISVAAIFGLAVTFARFRAGTISRGEAVFWTLLWAAVIVLVWNPAVTNRVAGFLGVGRGADAVFYIAIVVLFLGMFKLYGKLENLEHKLNELIKKLALRDLDKRQ